MPQIKKFSLKEIEDCIKEIGIPEYPKHIGNNLWKLSENCITNEKGIELFYKEVINTISNDNNR